jgi:hypothetical protein
MVMSFPFTPLLPLRSSLPLEGKKAEEKTCNRWRCRNVT